MPSAAPLCFDGGGEEIASAIVDALASTIIAAHDVLIDQRGFNPKAKLPEDETAERVKAAICASFCTYFGSQPSDRFTDVFDQVAHFASNFARDHIFLDGNKRTTMVMSFAILRIPGFTIGGDDSYIPEYNEAYRWIQDVVTNECTEKELAAYLRNNYLPVNRRNAP